jgi:hypothetical protein
MALLLDEVATKGAMSGKAWGPLPPRQGNNNLAGTLIHFLITALQDRISLLWRETLAASHANALVRFWFHISLKPVSFSIVDIYKDSIMSTFTIGPLQSQFSNALEKQYLWSVLYKVKQSITMKTADVAPSADVALHADVSNPNHDDGAIPTTEERGGAPTLPWTNTLQSINSAPCLYSLLHLYPVKFLQTETVETMTSITLVKGTTDHDLKPSKEEMNKVLSLCRANKWHLILSHVRENPAVGATPMAMDNKIATSVMHQAITSKGDTAIRATVIASILAATPEAAKITNGYGSLPLHVIMQRNTKMDSLTKERLVALLVQANKGALTAEGGVGQRTPIHILFTGMRNTLLMWHPFFCYSGDGSPLT